MQGVTGLTALVLPGPRQDYLDWLLAQKQNYVEWMLLADRRRKDHKEDHKDQANGIPKISG